ncbi:Nad-dependent 15-hydroxyprostaglandin dehydrogenase [Lasiodiplodia theobromae]|uniref:Nad-dependent 15-hydroxyprostaglandin dehydrogenase n=1 Tax=Lasiodiplodia theobromae TaxID=45133 RepID=UPI0015C3ACEF|nr:Nad-dependent 15-hydroxyprostaglandin dehydrogenase [Lasiodiplodia theobromae]KAF4543289.1 Nad-dependent 15-hydroxyprostaglandin dehydrogenase [Lasiodiplodia theobromae]
MEVGDFPLKGKIVVVTGGGSGIGFEIVKLAASIGSKVVVADLKLNEQAEAFVKSQDEKDLVFQRCDVTKRADLERLVEVAEQKWGEVPDVYMASAGVFEPATSNFWTDTETDSYTTLAVNVTAPLKLTRIALRAFLRSNKRGVVLLVSSIAGYAGTYAVPLYTASKHAVVGFAKSMRKADAEEGVKVVALCPGVVRTPLWTPGASEASNASPASSEGGKNGGQTNLLKDFAYPASVILEPAVVAQAAVRLAERGEYGGGTVLECTTAGLRVIPEWGVKPPPHRESGDRNTGAPREVVPPEKVEVKEYLARERRGGRSKL